MQELESTVKGKGKIFGIRTNEETTIHKIFSKQTLDPPKNKSQHKCGQASVSRLKVTYKEWLLGETGLSLFSLKKQHDTPTWFKRLICRKKRQENLLDLWVWFSLLCKDFVDTVVFFFT